MLRLLCFSAGMRCVVSLMRYSENLRRSEGLGHTGEYYARCVGIGKHNLRDKRVCLD